MSKDGILVELRPDRDLLDPNFDGYKLSLESVPIYKKDIEKGVDFLLPNDDQYSFLHVKLFSLHNHLYSNPHSNDNVYFVDKKWKVVKALLTPFNHLQGFQEVCEVPRNSPHLKQNYNLSISFPSSNIAVLSDGSGAMHVAIISVVEEEEKWRMMYSDNVLENDTSFVVNDSRLEVVDDLQCLHVVLTHIEEKTVENEEVKGSSYHTVLEWITLRGDNNKAWSKQSHKRLISEGSIDYVALEPGCKSILIVSDKIAKWDYDSENPIIEKAEESKKPEETESQTKLYEWSQNNEEINISFSLPEGTTKSDLEIKTEDVQMTIDLKGEVFLSGKFFQRIDNDLTTWSFKNSKLELHLTKNETGLMWRELIVGDKQGEQIINPSLVEEAHEQLAHLCSDKIVDEGQPTLNALEECDATSADTTFVRMSVEDHKVSHEISLSAFQWLFKIHCYPKKSPALCLRHDVDGCVWQFSAIKSDEKEWSYKHIGTFYALGYVQASKTQKKFLVSPPNMSYAVLCESSRHIYVYRQPSPVSGDLRNRTSGRKVKTISKQQLVNLETNEPILGVHATNSIVYILTEHILHVLQINE